MTEPAAGSTLTGSTVTFRWSTGSGVAEYWLQVGTGAAGAKGLFDRSTGSATSASVSGLPPNGTINVRLWSKVGNGWVFNDYTYAGSNGMIFNDSSISLNILGFSTSRVTTTLTATSTLPGAIAYAIQSQGQHGTASIDADSGLLTYSLTDLPSSATVSEDTVTVRATSGSRSATATVRVALRFDPLLPNQWHLRNTGQYAFADVRPIAGFDINVAPAWAAGFSGQGIKVGVVDSGLEIAHEDLAGNIDAGNSINFLNNGTDPTPSSGSGNSVGDHGTSVAGIIASEAFNGKGGRGVAFKARLRGYNWAVSSSETNFARSFGGDTLSADNDVFNGSFGGDSNYVGARYDLLPSYNQARTEVLNGTNALRGGKGATVVFSSGNDFEDNYAPAFLIDGSRNSGNCENAVRFGVTCGLPASSSFKQSIVPIIVGSLAADGRKASYSNTASSIWIAAPGGEGTGVGNGAEASIAGSGGPSNAYKPTITTTNLAGCAKYSLRWNALDNLGANPLAARCQYTATMTGTSSAAPMVAGVVALMLEANPNLTYRDVAHILAVTARKVDPTFAGVNATLVGARRTLEAGWVTNAAGYSFSNRYGFGAVDAGAAVAMARTFSGYLPARQFVQTTPVVESTAQSITAAGREATFQVSNSVTKTERAFVIVNITNRTYLNSENDEKSSATCTQIELVSPAGTRSILLNAANGFSNYRLENVLLSSNAFYGENPNGTWRLQVFDYCDDFPRQYAKFTTGALQEFAFTGH
jgi:subtilisin family serine protease